MLEMWTAVPLNATMAEHIEAGLVSYHYVDQAIVDRHTGFKPQLQVSSLRAKLLIVLRPSTLPSPMAGTTVLAERTSFRLVAKPAALL